MGELCISSGGSAGLCGFLCSRVAVGSHKLHVPISGGDAQMICCDNRAAKHLGTCWKTLGEQRYSYRAGPGGKLCIVGFKDNIEG